MSVPVPMWLVWAVAAMLFGPWVLAMLFAVLKTPKNSPENRRAVQAAADDWSARRKS